MLLPDISGSAWKDAVVELVVRYQDLDRLLLEVNSSCLMIDHYLVIAHKQISIPNTKLLLKGIKINEIN